MMTKNELVALITKKAKVPDNLAKELLDIFLIRVAEKITVGQTAYLENIGYFHLRKGKIRKPEKGLEKGTLESHDFIVLSQSPDLNIKSLKNLVLMVPEIEIQSRDEVDSHFRLSVEKLGMHNLKDRGTVFRLNQLSYDKRNELKEKVDSFISTAKTEKSISSKHGVLLVEMKKFSKDQLELNADDTDEDQETLDLSTHKKNGITKPKVIDEQLEKDNSKQFSEKQIEKKTEVSSKELDKEVRTDLNVEAEEWKTISEPTMDKKIELDKKVYENAESLNSKISDNLNNSIDGLNKPIMEDAGNLEEEKPAGSGDDNVNRKFKRIKLKGQSIKKQSLAEKKESKSFPLETIDTNKEKENEKISYKEKKLEEKRKIELKKEKEEEKIIQEKKEKLEEDDRITEEEYEEFEIEKYQKVIDGENQMHPEKFKEPSKIDETLAKMSELEEDEYAYDTEIDETYSGSRYRSSGMVILILFAAIILIGGGLYYFLFHKENGSSDLSQNVKFDNAVNTTYIDRNYDVPVSYPYSQSESEIELHGLSSELTVGQVSVEQSGTKESTTKVISNEKTIPPVVNEKVKSPPATNEVKNIPSKVVTDIVPSKPRDQVSQNVFKYGNTYAVQIAAFQTKKGAEDGAAKFIKSGYSAFIEEAVVKGKNWYRLRVGGFKTLDEAKQFQKSNK